MNPLGANQIEHPSLSQQAVAYQLMGGWGVLIYKAGSGCLGFHRPLGLWAEGFIPKTLQVSPMKETTGALKGFLR